MTPLTLIAVLAKSYLYLTGLVLQSWSWKLTQDLGTACKAATGGIQRYLTTNYTLLRTMDQAVIFGSTMG